MGQCDGENKLFVHLAHLAYLTHYPEIKNSRLLQEGGRFSVLVKGQTLGSSTCGTGDAPLSAMLS